MVAKVLHLQALITHTKSALGKTTHTHRTATQKDVHLDTFKSGSSGGFTKLSDGKDGDGRDEEQSVGFGGMYGHRKGQSEGALSVVVTRTVEVESETLPGDKVVKFNAADQDEFRRGLGRAV